MAKQKRKRNGCFGLLCLLLIVGCIVMAASLVLNGSRSKQTGSLYEGIPHSAEGVETFLIVGVGDDEEERENTGLTDTIMLAVVDKAAQSVQILQIPRDTYVGDITPTGKINAIYNRGDDALYHGLEGLSKRIYEMFLIPIDHYVLMDMSDFSNIIDAIGGIPMTVEQEMSYGGVTVYPGEQVLDGEHALVFVRTRNIYDTGDLGRVTAQRQFLEAFAEKIQSMGLKEIIQILPSVMSSIKTDLSLWDMLTLYLSVGTVDLEDLYMTMPPGEPAMINGQSVYLLYPEETAAMLNESFRPYEEDVSASQLGLPYTQYS